MATFAMEYSQFTLVKLWSRQTHTAFFFHKVTSEEVQSKCILEKLLCVCEEPDTTAIFMLE